MAIDIPRRTQTTIDRTDMHSEQGVYHFDDDNVTVISQPNFEQTLAAIADQPSRGTTIVTPELALLNDMELATFSKEMQQQPDMIRLLSERFMQLKEASSLSDNTVMMGAPLRSLKTSGYNNGMIVMKNGQTVHGQRKAYPAAHEESLGWFEYGDVPRRYHRMGRTALICSELLFALRMSPQEKANTDTLFVPAMWGISFPTPEAMKKHGSIDAYNTHNLTEAARWAAEDVPNLRTIYVADRPVGDNSPQVGRMKVK